MNWFQKHYGTGFGPIGAVIAIVVFSVIFWIAFEWWVGLSFFALFAIIFWTQRNTK